MTDRELGLMLLWEVLDEALKPEITHAVVAWLDDRNEDEGGFLWLVGLLGSRPAYIDAAIRGAAGSSGQVRKGIRERVRRVRALVDDV